MNRQCNIMYTKECLQALHLATKNKKLSDEPPSNMMYTKECLQALHLAKNNKKWTDENID